jgi:mRNA interferase RelE/StbE
MSYRVILSKSVQKQIDRLPQDAAGRVIERLAGLESEPRPHDVKKLKGRPAWRIRVGDYRIIYEIDDRGLRIIVVTVGQRGDVYR